MDFKPFKIGKYLLLERLAMGGMAEVYRAKASGAGGFEKQLAIKRILPNYSSNEEFRRMFEYEARLSSMLTHANIVQVYDFVKSGDTYLLAMEYVDGKNLRQFINKVKKIGFQLPVEFGVFIVNEVCKGLEYAHKKKDDLTGRPLNIIHRDMSPQNVMLSYEGAAKIVDFGIAKAKDRVDETRSGVIKGKFGYMSPEQANGEPVDHRTDIFSTVIILFELLTGRRLFATENDMATLKLIQECVIPSPSRINPKIQPELEKIILKGLTKDLGLRYQSAGNLHRNLQEFLNKFFPTFTQRDVYDTLQKVFHEEIEHEKKRFEQLYRQSIPFSQGSKEEGAPTDLDQIKDNLGDEEDSTKSEQLEQTAVTYIGDEQSSLQNDEPAPYDPEQSIAEERESDERTMAEGKGTQVDPLVVDEDRSVSTLGTGFNKPTKLDPSQIRKQDFARGTAEEDRTMVDDGSFEAPESTNTPTEAKTNRRPPPRNSERSNASSISKSGVTLQPNRNEESTRRKGGSISFIKEISSSNQNTSNSYARSKSGPSAHKDDRSEFSLSGASGHSPLEVEGRAPVRKRDRGVRQTPNEPMEYFATEESVPLLSRVRTLVSVVGLLGLLAGTIYIYSIYMQGGLPKVIRAANGLVGGKNPSPTQSVTELPEATTLAVTPDRKTATDCTIDIQSDPSSTSILVNDQEVGQTPSTLSFECQKAVDIVLKKDGYEVVSENVFTKTSSAKIYKVMKRIPQGTLELLLTQNAEIFIGDKLVALGKANQVAPIPPLRANRRYLLRFKNEVLGIDTTREYFVQENSVVRSTVRLEQSLNNKSPAAPTRPSVRRIRKR